MATRTAEETKAEHIERMGQPLGETFYHLRNDIALLHERWSGYRELYGTNERRVNLQNQATAHFFGTVQDIWWESILLHIARLTEAPRSGGKQLMTVRRLENLVTRDPVKKRLAPILREIAQKRSFCRDWRNNVIAHRNVEVVLKTAQPLGGASRVQVKEMLALLSDVMNVISRDYLDTTIAFDCTDPIGGAHALLCVVQDGLRYNEERKGRIQSGRPRPDDLAPPDF